jgi:D-ribulokinase
MLPKYFVGVDVGTGSARAGVFTETGKMIGSGKEDLKIFKYGHDFVEQSSADIWLAVCISVREAVSRSRIDAQQIASIGFDATCSLVVIRADGRPLPVGEHGEPVRNVIVWMDHRAIGQAEIINRTKHSVLDYVGGQISPEMETPKLLWLKENLRSTYEAASHFFDLADFLTWKASGSLQRSACTTTCKWTYLAHETRWDESFFIEIGLEDLTADSFARIGSEVVLPGTPLANGLTSSAAAELGLPVGASVPAGLIDAHAGGIGTVGATNLNGANPESCLAYVFGTSACTMTTTSKRVSVPGVWGPYYSAMLPDMWLLEAGQSAAGAAIDHLISMSPAFSEAKKLAEQEGVGLAQWISGAVKAKCTNFSDAIRIAEGTHVVPEFLGNRAPLADPSARAVIAGLGMDTSIDGLLSLYMAGISGLGYGLRQIIAAQEEKSVFVDKIAISGGAGSDPLIRQTIADSTGIQVVSSKADEPVLLGAAMLGATSSGHFLSLQDSMESMSSFDTVYSPCGGPLSEVHEYRYEAFLKLQSLGSQLRATSSS